MKPTDLKFNRESAEAYLDEISRLDDNDLEKNLNEWELEFLQSVRQRHENGFNLSPKQFSALEKIYKKICED